MDLLDRFLAQKDLLLTLWVPFLLVSAIAVLVIWRVLQWRYGATIDGLEHRLKLRDDTISHLERNRQRSGPQLPTVLPALETGLFVSETGERTFVEDNVTLKHLSGLYKDRTSLQADKLAAPHVGKWIEVSGKLEIATPFSAEASTVSLKLDETRDGFNYAWLMFLTDRHRLEALRPNDTITAVGRIKGFHGSEIQLLECELVAID